MKTTQNYGLNVFEGTDKVSLAKMNENTEKVDKALGQKQERLSGSANQLVGFDENGNAAAADYAVIHTGGQQLPARILVKKAGPLDVAPNTDVPGPHHVVSYGDYNGYSLYENLYKSGVARHYGRYSYANTRFKAYRLDHVTREAVVILDLLPDGAEDENYVSGHDTILAVDENYIYFAKHSVENNSSDSSSAKAGGNILKYDHAGNLVATGPASGDQGWLYDHYRSISSDNGGYYTIMYHVAEAMTYNAKDGYYTFGGVAQTKDFIILHYKGQQSTSGYLTNLTIISKEELKVMSGGTGNNGGVSYQFSSWDEGWFNAVYNGNFVYVRPYSITSCLFWALTTEVTDGYTQINAAVAYNSVVCDGYSGLYFDGLQRGPYKDADHCYYLVSTSDDKYSVITEDNIDPATGKITVNYLLSDSTYISADALRTNCDPVKGDFSYRDAPYQVYPTYTAPGTATAIPDGFSAIAPFKVDDYFYLRDSSYNVFRVKNATQYLFDRAEVIE